VIHSFTGSANEFRLWLDEPPFEATRGDSCLEESVEPATGSVPRWKSIVVEASMHRGPMWLYGLLGVSVTAVPNSGALVICIAKDSPAEQGLDFRDSLYFPGSHRLTKMMGFMPGYNEITLHEMSDEFLKAKLAFRGLIEINYMGYSPSGTSPRLTEIMARALPHLLVEPEIRREKVHELIAAPTYSS